MAENMTYTGAGVDYDAMDPSKRMAQLIGRETAKSIERLNNGEFREFEMSRGESVYLIEAAKSYFAHVEEGLGTKNLVADAMYRLTGKLYYDCIGQDTVGMIVNDMITLGALPLSVAMHLAVGDSGWFNDEERYRNLFQGWKHACDLAGCVWGCGEMPTLRDIIAPDTIVLSGSALGLIKPKERRITGNIQHGDSIILVDSSGVHANGLTLARRIAEKMSDGYLTKMGNGLTYGEALLAPTLIYVPLIEECLNRGINIHYAVNITGHGWRKLMRAKQPFTYVIEILPHSLPIFDFIQEHGPVDDREAYGNLNMSAGFALYVAPRDVDAVFAVSETILSRDPALRNPRHYYGVFEAGHIEQSETKRVVIIPKNLEYSAESLAVR